MASGNLQCPNCNLKLRPLYQLESRTIVCERCGSRYLQQLRKRPHLSRISLDSKDVSGAPSHLNTSFMCKNVKRTRRPFFRRSQHHQQLPPLNVLGNTGSTEARCKKNTAIESMVLPKPILQSVSGTSPELHCKDDMSCSLPMLPPLQPQQPAAALCAAATTKTGRKIQDREHLCLPEIHQRRGRMRQLRKLFSPSNLSQKFASSPEFSPLSPGSGKFLEVPSGDGWSSHDESGSECSAPSSAEYSRRPRLTSLSDFIQIWDEDAKCSNYAHTQELLYNTFSSWKNMVLSFKDHQSCGSVEHSIGIDMNFVHYVYDAVLNMPADVQKQVLKAVISGQLKEAKRSRHHSFDGDHLRCHLILLQNPQFHSVRTYVVFAQLLRQLASLGDEDSSCLVHWLRSLKAEKFKDLIHKLVQFISIRLFPSDTSTLPAISKCTWWIPSATKVLGLLERANWLDHPPIVPHTEFYNTALDHTDLMSEFYSWQSPQGHATMRFSFCQYPFILSMAAKRMILKGDSEQQMLMVAKHTLFDKKEWPHSLEAHDMFLNIVVRRSHLMDDSINELMQKQGELKKKVRVTFEGEPGVDLGGLTKEWFLLLTRKVFHSDYGLFVYHKDSGLYWFNSAAVCDDCSAYHLVGLLMGLAVYNSIILDIHFPLCCYKKLLGKSKRSRRRWQEQQRDRTVGHVDLGLHDLIELKPTVGNSLQEMLNYSGDVEEDFQCSFEISYQFFDKTVTKELIPSGQHMRVTNTNRDNFVSMYVDHVLNTSIAEQFSAFYEGFHSVCNSAALKLFRPEEVETLVCGCPELDQEQLEHVTEYEGYTKNDENIRWFWGVVRELSVAQQKKLLHFVTGSDRVPVEGTGSLTFIISKTSSSLDHQTLPMAQTCFNLILLPTYTSREELKEKLVVAIDNTEGFGME